MSRRGKRTCPLDLKLGHNNWLRQVKVGEPQGSVTQCGWFAAAPLQGCLGRLALTASDSSSGLQLCSLRNAASDVDLGVCGFLNSEPLIATMLLCLMSCTSEGPAAKLCFLCVCTSRSMHSLNSLMLSRAGIVTEPSVGRTRKRCHPVTQQPPCCACVHLCPWV